MRNGTPADRSADRLEAIRLQPLFAGLEESELRSLLELLREVKHSKGSVIFRQFDDGSGLYFILSGMVRISRVGRDGREIVLAEMREGNFFGEMSLLDGQSRSSDATAAEECRLLFLDREHFRTAILGSPPLLRLMLVELSKRLRAADQKIEQLALGSVFDRLFHLLGHIGRRFPADGKGRHTIRGGPTHQELAEQVGTSRETVTRTLAAMEARGLISLGTRAISLLPLFFEEEQRNRS